MALRLRGIRKRFGATVALDGVDLEFVPGEVHALIGENGAGKSTLLAIVAGEFPPDGGEMDVEGRPYRPSSPRDARAEGIALIHQELSLFPHLTVAENILMGREPARHGWVDPAAAKRRALEVLREFDRPEIRPEARVADLSLAARQVVEICRAIAAEARVVLMDEPTSSLQGDDVQRLFALIRRLRERGLTVVYISHFLEEVRQVADRFTVLRDGAHVATGPLAAVTDQELITHMVGRSIENLFPPRGAGLPGEPALVVAGLSNPPALHDVSFEVRKGEVLGIAGLMGSGRTALVRSLFGLFPPRGGAIRLSGRTLGTRATPRARLAQGLGYLSEDRKGEGLALSLPIADNITLTRMSTCARAGWLSLAAQGRQARAAMDRLRVKARTPFQPTKTLSGGNQQKVAVARLGHQDARVMLLDEPTRGVDVGSKVQIYEAIRAWAAEGRAVLMVSSYLPELFGMCDRIAVMRRGRLSPARPVGEWTPESVLEAAIGGPAPLLAPAEPAG
ncbi:MAG TPA: sugar ABC transporter ATP-binding protein [Vicinamibacteria bacterium]|nr:sugar ABC transporter ATP-binding protein [Vicinamibacteria bacterium]